jgi:oxygen-independent coproporphyrinogen-3 oxidase
MIGLYLHIPYCLRKCAYCDFASLPLDEAGGLAAARRYLDALAIELDRRAFSDEFSPLLRQLATEATYVDTVYIGGGTPTILPPDWLASLFDRIRMRFTVRPDAELTVEANPGTVDEAKISALLAAGVNRISLGVQSFSDPVLQTLGRIHTAAEAHDAIAAARAAGCSNLSLDLMYGIPNQSLADWRTTLEAVVKAGPDHISAYALSVEPGTRLCDVIAAHELPPPDEDLAADMYLLAQDLLGDAGYDHYEISNFARPGMQCRHNRRYWACDEYLGLGAASHTFRGGVRWNNLPDPAVYTRWIEQGRLPVARAEALSARESAGEMLILGLRRAEGVREKDVLRRCGISPSEVFRDEIGRLCEDRLLIVDRGRLRIPREAWLVSNEVLSAFVA